MWLDTYDDLFSDFDPRPYSKRAVSDDFIFQVKKVTKDQPGSKMMLKLLLPEAARNRQDEEIIAERLHGYFIKSYEQLLNEKKQNNRKGIQLTAAGVVLMIAASYISFLKPEAYSIHLMLILFEPAGWFLLWVGLDDLVYYSRKTKKELDFYSKMALAEFEFDSYN